MDGIHNEAGAPRSGYANESGLVRAAAGQNAVADRRVAKGPAGYGRHSAGEYLRLEKCASALLASKRLRSRVTTPIQAALRLAESGVLRGRRAPRSMTPAVFRREQETKEVAAATDGLKPESKPPGAAVSAVVAPRFRGLASGACSVGAIGGKSGHNLVPFRIKEAHNPARLSTSAPLAARRGEVTGNEIAVVEAERVGMSAQRLERVGQLNQRYVDAGKIAGALTAVVRDGKLVYQCAAGTRSTVDTSPLSADSLFRIYSLSKPVTAVAAMQLYEQGKFQLSDSVARYVPELKQPTVMKDGEVVPAEQRMTMQHLLTHTAGLSYGADPRDPVDRMYLGVELWRSKDLDEVAEKLTGLPLKFEPGAQWHYSVASDVVGLVVQRLSGQPLDQYFEQHIFRPLDMADTSFAVPKEKADRLLPNHIRDKDTGKAYIVDSTGTLPVSPPSALEAAAAAHDYHNVTLFAGGFGLVTTLRDYVRFAEAARAGGCLGGSRILGPKSVDYMASNHLPGVLKGGYTGAPLTGAGLPIHGAGFGLGYAVVTDPSVHGVVGSPGQYYWNGLAGSTLFIDPKEDIAVVSMMQLMNPWFTYPQELRVATYQAMTESKVRN